MCKALKWPVIAILLGLVTIGPMLHMPSSAWAASPAKTNQFGSINFSINKLSPSAQVELLMKNGYGGIVTSLEDATTLQRFLELPAVQSGQFKLIANYWVVNLNKPINRDEIDALARELRRADADLWVTFFGFVGPQELRTKIGQLADIANAHGVTVVLYPHYGLSLATTEEAVRWMNAVGRNNIKVALHLCHELKAGHGARLPQIIQEAAPYLAGITINGADRDVGGEGIVGNGSGYERSIQTLDQGDFDVRDEFYLPLIRAGYKGPIVLHDFGMKPDHFARSMAVLKSWSKTAIAPHAAQDAKLPSDNTTLAAMVAELRAEVANLRDRQQINDLYVRYIRGLDRLDEQLHNSAYWPDAELNYGGPGSMTIEKMWKNHLMGYPNGPMMSWAHLLTNQTVDIDGDMAHVETYVTGMAVPKDKGSAAHHGSIWASGGVWSGRYFDRLERRNGEWRIAVREFIPHFGMTGDMDTYFTANSDAYPYSCVHSRRDTSYVRPLSRRKDSEDRAPCAK